MLATLTAKLLPFAARFVLTFFLLLAPWPFVSPLYARGMAAAGGTLLNAVSLMPRGGRLEARERRVWILRPVTKVDGSQGMAGVNVLDDATYFNFVLLASLIAATPALRWTAKLKAFALGFVLLAALHFADLYVKMTWTAIHPGLRLRGVVPDPASPAILTLFEWLFAFFSILGFGLFPILVWLGVVSLLWPRDASATPQNLRK